MKLIEIYEDIRRCNVDVWIINPHRCTCSVIEAKDADIFGKCELGPCFRNDEGRMVIIAYYSQKEAV